MAKSPVVVIGLDAADPAMLSRLMESGLMPNLRSIKDRGAWGTLRSPDGLGDDATWASFATGASPAKHGRYFHRLPARGTYTSRSFKEDDTDIEPFWSVLGRAGHSIGVLDVPKSPLASGLNGFQLSDWRVHGRDGRTRSWPPELAQSIIDSFGDDDTDKEPDYLCKMEKLPDSMYGVFVDRLLVSIEQKLKATRSMLGEGKWDLFIVVFKEAHCIGHQCWHLTDPAHPEYDGRLAAELSQPVNRVYSQLDKAVGRLLEEVPDNATVIVFSTLGMDENVTGEHLLESILLRLEPSSFWSAWQRLYDFAGRFRSSTLRRYVRGVQRRLMPYRTAYHVEHNELSGAIRLNLVGRESDGRISQSEREETLDRLQRELMRIVDVDTGQPIVNRVIRTDSVYEGKNSDVLADLLVEWNRERSFTTVHSPTIGRLKVERPSWRTGNHVPGGVFFAAGPAVESHLQELAASIEDLSVSIAAALGCSLPDADGRRIPAIGEGFA